MKKLLIKLSIIFGLGIVTGSQLNYEQAISKAKNVSTDGEIREVMASHGFHQDIFQNPGPIDKVNAFFTTINKPQP